ncbi:MAG: hypothetical protein ABIF40_01655 [archaeon]
MAKKGVSSVEIEKADLINPFQRLLDVLYGRLNQLNYEADTFELELIDEELLDYSGMTLDEYLNEVGDLLVLDSFWEIDEEGEELLTYYMMPTAIGQLFLEAEQLEATKQAILCEKYPDTMAYREAKIIAENGQMFLLSGALEKFENFALEKGQRQEDVDGLKSALKLKCYDNALYNKLDLVSQAADKGDEALFNVYNAQIQTCLKELMELGINRKRDLLITSNLNSARKRLDVELDKKNKMSYLDLNLIEREAEDLRVHLIEKYDTNVRSAIDLARGKDYGGMRVQLAHAQRVQTILENRFDFEQKGWKEINYVTRILKEYYVKEFGPLKPIKRKKCYCDNY